MRIHIALYHFCQVEAAAMMAATTVAALGQSIHTHTHSAGLMITVCSDKSTSSVARLWNRHKFIYKYWKNAYRTNDVHKAGFHPSCRLAPQIQHPYTERKRERERFQWSQIPISISKSNAWLILRFIKLAFGMFGYCLMVWDDNFKTDPLEMCVLQSEVTQPLQYKHSVRSLPLHLPSNFVQSLALLDYEEFELKPKILMRWICFNYSSICDSMCN